MKALNFFKNYGKSLVLGLGLLGGIAFSNDASAQEKPKQDKKKTETPRPQLSNKDSTWQFQDSSRKVLKDVKGAKIFLNGMQGVSDTSHTRDLYKYKKGFQKSNTPTGPGFKIIDTTIVDKNKMNLFYQNEQKKKDGYTPQQHAEAWKKKSTRDAFHAREDSAKKNATSHVQDTIPLRRTGDLGLQKQDSVYQEKIDTLKITNTFIKKDTLRLFKPDTVYRQPFRVMAGLIERNTMGKKRDVNAPADREFTEVFPVAGHEKAKGKFIEISKDFGQIFRGYARAEWYESDTLTKLIAKDNMDATLVNTKAMSADFDNNYQFGVDVAPPIGWNGGKVKIGSKNILEDKLKRHNEKGSFALILQPSLGLNYRVAMNQNPKLVYIEQDRYDPNPVRLSMIQEQNMKTNSTGLSVRGGLQAFVEYGKAFTRTKYKTDKDGKSVPHKVIVGEIAGFLNAGVMVNRTIAGGNPVLHQTATGEAYGAPKNFYTKQVAIGVKVSF